MRRLLLVLTVFVAVFSVAVSVKEWKNFENGKVYSHKTPNEKKPTKPQHRAPVVVEERLLHSHHHDKNVHRDPKPSQAPDQPQHRSGGGKNLERHHKKNVEDEMHLRPLNERHHKFPNPQLLNKAEQDSPTLPHQISRHKLLRQQEAKQQQH